MKKIRKFERDEVEQIVRNPVQEWDDGEVYKMDNYYVLVVYNFQSHSDFEDSSFGDLYIWVPDEDDEEIPEEFPTVQDDRWKDFKESFDITWEEDWYDEALEETIKILTDFDHLFPSEYFEK